MSNLRITVYFLAVPAVIFAALFMGWFSAINSQRAHVLVRNHSGKTLSNLTVDGSHEHQDLDSVTIGSEWQTRIKYDKGGQVRFSFSSDQQRYSSTSDIYTNHSGSCGVTFTVLSNMVIEPQVAY